MDAFAADELVKRVAWMYYEDELNQQEIAEKLKLSRAKVLRLLKESRESGFVKITLSSASGLFREMEDAICRASGLRECLIVPAGEDVILSTAKGVAYRFAEALRSCKSVGVGGGRTLELFAGELKPPETVVTQEIVALSGNTKPNFACDPNHMASILATKLPSRYFQIWAPAKTTTREAALLLRQNPAISSILEKAYNVELSIVGIGDMKSSSYVRHGFLDESEMAVLTRGGAVGEILGCFFNMDGEPVGTSVSECNIAVSMPMKGFVIGVAGGPDKVRPIVGAIRAGWISGLITDEVTANTIIRCMREAKAG